MDENKPEVRSDLDYLEAAVMADTNALEDAKMPLEIIKETDPGVYDEMINDTLALIRGWALYCVKCSEPVREWQGLTDEEAKKTFEKHNCTISADLAGILARAITAKLKEKNNG
jgi:hypothetical protein